MVVVIIIYVHVSMICIIICIVIGDTTKSEGGATWLKEHLTHRGLNVMIYFFCFF